jgi:hypothetical protein
MIGFFLAGYRQVAGSAFSVPQIMILDEEGNMLQEILFEDGDIEAFDVDNEKNMYISMRVWSGHNVYRRKKVNESGDVFFDIESNYELIDFKVTENKEMVGLFRLLDNLDKEGLIFFDQEGNEVWQIPTGRSATESRLYLLPTTDIGLAFSKTSTDFEGSVWLTETFDRYGQIKEPEILIFSSSIPGFLFFPDSPYYHLGYLTDILVTEFGEVFITGYATYNNTDYIIVASKWNAWIWWYRNETPIKGASHLALYETEQSLKLIADTRPELRVFSLGRQNLDFDHCAYNPLWMEKEF